MFKAGSANRMQRGVEWTRLKFGCFEEWKANNDLLKFHEDLKQKRFAHFLTVSDQSLVTQRYIEPNLP